ncbi:hypothetical protein [Parendozoicomonas sp. Alg238-R29]|uniref:hypothetical protein n=1 Tax=Parendozoicomonas sp. Alg238-R29 TaxID=2993446 RepID=UPI00248D837C|nr:hypothetical protein [Parendozoicomonas sp. Alg238-R29]
MRKINLIGTTSALLLLFMCRAQASEEAAGLPVKPSNLANSMSFVAEASGSSDNDDSGSSHLPTVSEDAPPKEKKRVKKTIRKKTESVFESAVPTVSGSTVRLISQELSAQAGPRATPSVEMPVEPPSLDLAPHDSLQLNPDEEKAILAAVEKGKKTKNSWSDVELIDLRKRAARDVLAGRIRGMYGNDDTEQAEGANGVFLIKLTDAKTEAFNLVIDVADLLSKESAAASVEAEETGESSVQLESQSVSQSEALSNPTESLQVSEQESRSEAPAKPLVAPSDPTGEESAKLGEKILEQIAPAKTVAIDLKLFRVKTPIFMYGGLRYLLSWVGLHYFLDPLLTSSTSFKRVLVDDKDQSLWEAEYLASPDGSYFVTFLGVIEESEEKTTFAYAKVTPEGSGEQLSTMRMELFTSLESVEAVPVLYEEDRLSNSTLDFSLLGPQSVQGREIRYLPGNNTKVRRGVGSEDVESDFTGAVAMNFVVPDSLGDDLYLKHNGQGRLSKTFQENFTIQNMFLPGNREGLFPLLNPDALHFMALRKLETGKLAALREYGAVDDYYYSSKDGSVEYVPLVLWLARTDTGDFFYRPNILTGFADIYRVQWR